MASSAASRLSADAVCNSYDWVEYFYQNAPEPPLPWDHPRRLGPEEFSAVHASIQQFQLGESSSGRRLIERANAFSRKTGDLGFVAAVRLFIHEEQRHSRILARFLKLEGAECVRRHWADSLFRLVRGLAGLELCMKVLATAEVIARPYYAALKDATGSVLLREICQLILHEETEHLRFQAFTFRQFTGRRAVIERALKNAHKIFLFCTAATVWLGHRRVFHAANRNFSRFWSDCESEFEALYLECSA